MQTLAESDILKKFEIGHELPRGFVSEAVDFSNSSSGAISDEKNCRCIENKYSYEQITTMG